MVICLAAQSHGGTLYTLFGSFVLIHHFVCFVVVIYVRYQTCTLFSVSSRRIELVPLCITLLEEAGLNWNGASKELKFIDTSWCFRVLYTRDANTDDKN